MSTANPWLCTNSACHAPRPATAPLAADVSSPRCACGALMKKRYASPVFRYLDFLRDDSKPFLSRPLPYDSTRKGE